MAKADQWREILWDEDEPPADVELLLGHWDHMTGTTVWRQEIDVWKSTRGGWVKGYHTHWMPAPQPPVPTLAKLLAIAALKTRS